MASKIFQRTKSVLLFSGSSLIISFTNIVLSLLVVRLCSEKLWGEFTGYYLWIMLAAHVAAWGNKEFLIRTFSSEPHRINELWRNNFFTRLPLLIIFLAFIFILPLDLKTCVLLSGWLAARFFYSAFDAVIVFRKKFSFTIAAEMLQLLIQAAVIFYEKENLTLQTLFLFMFVTELLKGMIMIVSFWKNIFPLHGKIKWTYFKDAMPFFLLGITGLLSSRMDLYCVNFYLPKTEVARYQVLMNFVTYILASSNYILIPFVKNIYRMSAKVINRISWLLTVSGIFICALAIPLTSFLCSHFYKMNFDRIIFVYAFMYALPIFWYLPKIYLLYKFKHEKNVLLTNVFSIVINFVLNIFLIPSYGIQGALLAAAVAQLSIIISFVYFEKKLNANDKVALP